MRTTKRFGWIRDLPDKRDLKFPIPEISSLVRQKHGRGYESPFPIAVDLTSQLGSVYDQGQLGACVANAIAGAIVFEELLADLWEMLPSRLFIYFNGRSIEGSIASDSGLQVRDGFKAIGLHGVCQESQWDYSEPFQEMPWPKCYIRARKDLALQYLSVAQDLNTMKACLAAGFPIVVGFTAYDSFESDQVAATGVVPMPDLNSESVAGGHCVLAAGYDDASATFRCRNSWGADWGQAGNFTIPYAYFTDPDLAGDFWTLRKMES
jgi:C1A family cysteine protease